MLAFHSEKKSPATPEKSASRTGVDGAEPIRCAGCGASISREDARIEMAGAHRHRFTNPAGYVWDIVCLGDAPGCFVEGQPTLEHTWFAGWAWSYASCAACNLHLGWCYTGAGRFFGLIEGRLLA